MTHQSQADLVVERFGSRARLSAEIGEPEEKIRNWQRSGLVPQKYHYEILVAARRVGVPLLPHDFVAYLVTQMLSAAEAADA